MKRAAPRAALFCRRMAAQKPAPSGGFLLRDFAAAAADDKPFGAIERAGDQLEPQEARCGPRGPADGGPPPGRA